MSRILRFVAQWRMVGASVLLVSMAGPSLAQQPAGPGATAPRPNQPTTGQPVAGPPVAPAAPPVALQAPEWFPLPADHQKYLDDVLNYWEQSSARVQKYRCTFNRFTYDPTFVGRDPKTGEQPAKTISSGEIMYASPDKGLFREDKIDHFQPPRAPGEKAQYQATPGEKGDHWVCDGKSIFVFDYINKKVVQTELPPDMQGKAIVDGPLPFMFGAEAKKVKDRFWARIITPPDVKNEYWLEAHPKRREDAANFKMIKIIIDVMPVGQQKFALPKAMAIYDRGPSYQSFSFEGREVNWNEPLQNNLNPFFKQFFVPNVPPGWKLVLQKQSDGGPRVANQGAGPNNSPRPLGPELPKVGTTPRPGGN